MSNPAYHHLWRYHPWGWSQALKMWNSWCLTSPIAKVNPWVHGSNGSNGSPFTFGSVRSGGGFVSFFLLVLGENFQFWKKLLENLGPSKFLGELVASTGILEKKVVNFPLCDKKPSKKIIHHGLAPRPEKWPGGGLSGQPYRRGAGGLRKVP